MLDFLHLNFTTTLITIVLSIILVVGLSVLAAILLFRSDKLPGRDKKRRQQQEDKKTVPETLLDSDVNPNPEKETTMPNEVKSKNEMPNYSFRTSDLNISTLQPEAGSVVQISCKLTNEGNSISEYTAELKLNGQVADRQTILMFGGKTRTITFSQVLAMPGDYLAEIGDLKGKFTVVPKKELEIAQETQINLPPQEYPTQEYPNVRLTDLEIEPENVNSGEKAIVSFLVINQSQYNEEYEAELSIDGQSVGRRTVLLTPGQQQRVVFQGTIESPGKHFISIGELEGILYVIE